MIEGVDDGMQSKVSTLMGVGSGIESTSMILLEGGKVCEFSVLKVAPGPSMTSDWSGCTLGLAAKNVINGVALTLVVMADHFWCASVS